MTMGNTILPCVGISQCLLGDNVRYDGGHKLDSVLIETLGRPVCPRLHGTFHRDAGRGRKPAARSASSEEFSGTRVRLPPVAEFRLTFWRVLSPRRGKVGSDSLS